MFVEGGAEYDNVVQVGHADFIAQIPKACFHETLEGGGRITQSKWDANPLVQSPRCYECSEKLTFKIEESIRLMGLL